MTQDTLDFLTAFRSPNHHHIFTTRTEKKRYSDKDPLYRVYRGTLETYVEKLLWANERNAGVYTQPNQDFKSHWHRFAADVVQARALWLDIDDKKPRVLTHQPTMTLETARGYQHIYCIEHTADMDGWRVRQSALVKENGADTQCKGANQLLRVPGFNHCKRDPYLVRIVDATGQMFSLADFDDLVPNALQISELSGEAKYEGARTSIIDKLDYPLSYAILMKALKKVWSAQVGSRFVTLRDQAYHVGHFIPYGLPFELAYSTFRSVAMRWKDEHMAKNSRVIFESLRDGRDHAYVEPPNIPEEQIRTWERRVNRQKMLATLSMVDLGDTVVVRDLLDSYPVWEEAWDTPRQATQAINSVVREKGYERKVRKHNGRSNGRNEPYWVRGEQSA